MNQPQPASRNLRIAVVQMACLDERQSNLDNAVAAIESAAIQGAELVCLQELFTTRYFCQSEDHRHFEKAESIPGLTSQVLCEAARRQQVAIVAGLFERRSAGIFHNSAIAIDSDGEIAGTYRKMHIPDDPFFHEKFYFTPGDLGFKAIDTRLAKIGLCICWDQWFPEAARLTAMQGADILVYPTAIGWLAEDKEPFGESQLSAWQTMMRSHAIANGVFLVAPNRVGVEDNIQFWGHSFICDPYGNIIAESSSDSNDLLVADCDLSSIETARTHWPFFRDRRIDAYGDLTRRWNDG